MARQFTRASSQYLDCGSNSVHNVANITVAAWAYADSYSSPAFTDYIISRESSTSPYAGFILRQLFGNARFIISVGSSNYEATGTLPSTGTWHHWAGTYDGETVTLWINGSSAATNTSPSGNMWAAPAGTKTYIGEGYGFTGRYWDGKLAEIGLWNRALSADDIAALADGFAPSLFPRGLISYWPLMGRISPEPDWFGGQTGSLVNTPTYADHPPKIIRARRRNRIILPASGFTGTFSGSFGAATGSLSGTFYTNHTGTFTESFSAPTGSFTSTFYTSHTGTFTEDLGAVTGSLAGTFYTSHTGTFSEDFGAVTGSISAVYSQDRIGTLSGSLGAVVGSLSGNFTTLHTGSFDENFGALTGSLTGTFFTTHTGEFTESLGPVTGSFSGTVANNIGTFSETLGGMTGTISGTFYTSHTGTFSETFGPVTGSIVSTFTTAPVTGSFTEIFGAMTGSLSGTFSTEIIYDPGTPPMDVFWVGSFW